MTAGGAMRAGSRWTETGVVLVAVMLVAGVVAGIVLGGAFTRGEAPVSVADALAWLRDEPRGEAVQVNPATGRAENRLPVAGPGTGFQLAQRDGLLVVTRTDGTVSLVDV